MTRSKKRLPHSTDLDIRYVTERPNKKGLRRYWQRRGHKLVRLPNDITWAAVATALNRAADSCSGAVEVVEGTMGWLVAEYRASDRYARLSKSSKAAYDRWLAEFERRWGRLPVSAISRRVVVKFINMHDGHKASQNLAAAVLYNVLDLALYHGLVEQNYAARLRIGRAERRDAVWSPQARASFLSAARLARHPWAVRLFFHLLLYTGQRRIDVARMRWSDFDGATIRVRQQKTGKLLDVPCHRHLRRILSLAKRKANGVFILAQPNGRPWTANHLTAMFREVRNRAELDGLQARDLRRTAAVLLAEAGCTDFEVTAITGHDIETSRRILETYVPRNQSMARAAIAKWERNGPKKSNALDKTGA